MKKGRQDRIAETLTHPSGEGIERTGGKDADGKGSACQAIKDV